MTPVVFSLRFTDHPEKVLALGAEILPPNAPAITCLDAALYSVLTNTDFDDTDLGITFATHGTTGPDIYPFTLPINVFNPVLLANEVAWAVSASPWADHDAQEDFALIALRMPMDPAMMGVLVDAHFPHSAHDAMAQMRRAIAAYDAARVAA